MDNIVIRDLEVEARVGVTEQERAQPQRLLVSVELDLDLREAGRSDNVAKTTDYAMLADLIRRLATKKPHNLVESIAEELADAILQQKLAQAVTIEVKKFSVPRTQHVAVQIRRPQ